jgi:hypothetical protein
MANASLNPTSYKYKKSLAAVVIDTYQQQDFLKEAVLRCRAVDRIEKIYFFGSNPLNVGENFYKINRIKSINEYNSFVLYTAPFFVEEDYICIFQWDGYPINPTRFLEVFLDYDYIGAPWPHLRDGKQIVGNGGFSIRSNRLMQFISNNRIELEKKSIIQGQKTVPEDVYICITLHEILNQNGFTFAPVEIASQFSFEAPPTENTFGFHGAFNLPFLYPEDYLMKHKDELFMRINNDLIRNLVIRNSTLSNHYRLSKELTLQVTINQYLPRHVAG